MQLKPGDRLDRGEVVGRRREALAAWATFYTTYTT
jgi:hypothetical protein